MLARLVKFGVLLAVLAFAIVLAYAYFGDMSAEPKERVEPLTLGGS